MPQLATKPAVSVSPCKKLIPQHDYKPLREKTVQVEGVEHRATVCKCSRCAKEITAYVVAY